MLLGVVSDQITVRWTHAARRTEAAGEAVARDAFETFVRTDIPRLRQALLARYGPDLGGDSLSAATAWAWENWTELSAMANRVGYLFRVAQSSQRPTWAWRRRTLLAFPAEHGVPDRTSSVDLGMAISSLSERQRVCVLLVHAHSWTYAEVAGLLAISEEAVTNHVHRGKARMRKLLEEST
jgi:DNA-directed RNA polymerase specialized sigma24 family protein